MVNSLWRSVILFLLSLVVLHRAACAPGENRTATADARHGVLRQIIISDTRENAQQLTRAAVVSGSVRSSLLLFRGNEIVDALQPFFGQGMERPQLRELGEAVVAFVRARDVPIVKVHVPEQSAEELAVGTVCVIVTLGRYGSIISEGHRFSNRESFRRELGLDVGDDARLSKLGAAIDWVNTNPFRSVDAVLRDAGEGRADLELQLREQRPYRVVAAYDNHGTVYTGRSRYTAAVHAGDLWRARHQLFYEFSRTRRSQQYQAHALEYRLPLRWRGYLVLDAAYSVVRPELASSSLTAEGRNFVGTLRHVLYHRLGRWAAELSTGVNFKAIRSDLEFGGAPYLIDGHPFQDFHIYQLSLTETLRRYDTRGSWWLALTANLSPGGLDARNDNAAFARSRTGAVARYSYATFSAERFTRLPRDLQLSTKILGQLSTGRLLASEQIWLGGAATLRGYPERTYPGDAIWSVTQELRSPAWSRPAGFFGADQTCRFQLLSFVDAGRGYVLHATSGETREPVLISAGVGLRGNVGRYIDVAFDYGWPLRRSANSSAAPGGRGQVQGRLFF